MQHEIERGREQCKQDIALGQFQLYYQTRGAWGEFLVKLMKTRFNVTVVHTSDMTTVSQMSFQKGYNQIIMEHIDHTYGTGSSANALREMKEFRTEHYRQHSNRGR